MQVIPAIDIIDGVCVRLSEGDYSRKTIYSSNPVEVAKAFEGAGLTRLHMVDLDGAKKGTVVNWKVLEAVANNTQLIIDFSGGIKTTETLQQVFDAGAAIAAIGSIAVKDPLLFGNWLATFGADKILLGADVKNETIVVHGWTESTDLNIIDFLGQQSDNGLTQFFCTDVGKDGLLQGPSIGLYQQLMQAFPKLQLIASGGVSCAEDLVELKNIGCSGAIVGKAFYEGKISLTALSQHNN
jgi:phosphoribosylformimino-5-aminoimidazole carboxamide ribotide isomerase